MALLGVKDNDVVWVEGLPASGSTKVPAIKLKVFATPDDVHDLRASIMGGDFDSRFPDALDALSVYPDIPWIFIDLVSRRTLGIENNKLAPVRVRASRQNQISEEIRELVLVLLLTFVGFASIVESPVILIGILSIITIVAMLLIRTRIRSRLRGEV